MKRESSHRELKRKLRTAVKRPWAAYAVAFGIIGVAVLLVTHAASNSYSFSVSDGAVAGNAAKIGGTAGSSNGTVVKFNAPSGGGMVTLPNPGSWVNITGNMAGLPASCGNFGGIWPVPNSAALIAGVGEHNLYKSANGGSAWASLGTGSGSTQVINRVGVIIFDPANANTFYEAGIYGNAGAYKSTDGGTTFTQLGSVFHIDSMSVDFTDPARKTMVAGGHEQAQKVFKSTDGGNTWLEIGGSLPGGTGFSSYVHVVNASTYLVATYPSYSGGAPGIYRTTNGGSSWTKVSSEPANQAPVITANGTIIFSSGNSIVKSSDNGVTWAKVGAGLRSELRPVELPDGRLVSANTNNKLVASSDGGNSWAEFGAALPYGNTAPAVAGIAGISFSPVNKAFYIWHWDCGNNVLPDAVEKLQAS